MKINKKDTLNINKIFKEKPDFLLFNLERKNWSKNYIHKKKPHIHKNYFLDKNHYVKDSDIEYSYVVDRSLMEGSSFIKGSTKVTFFYSSLNFKRCDIEINGYCDYILKSILNLIDFVDKDTYLKVIYNYYKILLINVDKKKYPEPSIDGSVKFIFYKVDKKWSLSMIDLKESANGFVITSSYYNEFLSLSFFGQNNIFKEHEQGLLINIEKNKLESIKLNELNNRYENSINFFDYLYLDDISEACNFVELVNF